MRLTLASFLVLAVALTGCNRESPRGGPGAGKGTTTTTTKSSGTPSTMPPTTTTKNDETGTRKTTTTTTTTTTKDDTADNKNDRDNRRDTFTIKVPEGQNVTQGKNQEVNISISRGGDFKQNVKLDLKAPAGLKVQPAHPMIKSGENSVKVLIEADDNAPVGRQNITVTGTPDTGAATSVEMPVDVKKRS
jgi:uncharacterized membrane protein